jgi:hypothetical protein
MALLEPGGANYIGVRNVQAAVAWYIEKLALRKIKVELDDGDDCVALGFEKDDVAVVLGPVGKPNRPIRAAALLVEACEGAGVVEVARRPNQRGSRGPPGYALLRNAGEIP